MSSFTSPSLFDCFQRFYWKKLVHLAADAIRVKVLTPFVLTGQHRGEQTDCSDQPLCAGQFPLNVLEEWGHARLQRFSYF